MYRLDEIDANGYKSNSIVFERNVTHISPIMTVGFDLELYIVDVETQERRSVDHNELYYLAESYKVCGVTCFENLLCVSILSQRAYECLDNVKCTSILVCSAFKRKLTSRDKERFNQYNVKITIDNLAINNWNEGIIDKSNALFYSASYCFECFERLCYSRQSYDVYESSTRLVNKSDAFRYSNAIDLVLNRTDLCFFYNSGRNFAIPLWSDDSYRYILFECSPKFMLEMCG